MKKYLLAFVALLVFLGCSKEYAEFPAVKDFVRKDPDSAGAIKAIRGYNESLILSYKHNDPAPLKDYATDRELGKVSHLINGFIGQNLRLEAELKEMRIEKVERWGEDNVVVTTLEKWKYKRINTSTNQEAKPLTGIDYHMRYNMIRKDGLWKVFDLSPV